MKTSIKRSELYAKVWQMPMTRLAKEFDISDVGLAKACKKHNIPTPRAGYWAKFAYGKAPSPTPLPEGDDVLVRLKPSNHRIPPAAIKPAAVLETGLIAAVAPIAAPEELDEKLAAHSRATLAALKKTKPDKSGFIQCRSNKAFTCVISTGPRDRAVRILDALERTVNNIGGHWKPDEKAESLQLEFDGESMQFSLIEQYRRTEHVETDPKYSWWTKRTYQYHFSGELTINLDASFQGQRTWSDGKRHKLEDKLAEFAAGVQNAARAIKELREEREAQHRRWEEEARIRREAEEKERQFNEFRANLVAEASAWHDFQRVSQYVQHLEQLLAQASENQNNEAKHKWMAMAHACVASLDPAQQRVDRLQHPVADSYYGLFGRPIV